MTKNQLDYWNLQETKRANLAKERELNRHQVRDEGIKEQSNLLTYNLGLQNLSETQRSHQTDEAERARNNRVNNLVELWKNEISEQNLDVNRLKALVDKYNAETGRINAGINQQNVNLGYSNLGELQRSNLARESIQQQQVDETKRSNIENENIKRFANSTQAARQQNQTEVDQFNATEAQRSHQAQEHNNLINSELRSLELQHKIDYDTSAIQQRYYSDASNNLFNVIGNTIRANGRRNYYGN